MCLLEHSKGNIAMTAERHKTELARQAVEIQKEFRRQVEDITTNVRDTSLALNELEKQGRAYGGFELLQNISLSINERVFFSIQ